MDDTTQQQNNQGPHVDSTTDDLAAMLGFITSISQMHMQEANAQQEPQEGSQGEESAPGEEKPEETPKEAPKQESGALGDIKAARQDTSGGDIGARLDQIEAELQELLKEEKADNGTETKDTEPSKED